MNYTKEVRDLIKEKLNNAKKIGKKSIVLSSKELHEELKYKKRFPIVCNAMRQMMTSEKDKYINDTPSKQSSTIIIEYCLEDK